jgi:hypothetical protein
MKSYISILCHFLQKSNVLLISGWNQCPVSGIEQWLKNLNIEFKFELLPRNWVERDRLPTVAGLSVPTDFFSHNGLALISRPRIGAS